RQIVVGDGQSAPAGLDERVLSNRNARILQEQPQQRDRALPEHGRLGAPVENARLGIEAERAELVAAISHGHWSLLASFWERFHDFPPPALDIGSVFWLQSNRSTEESHERQRRHPYARREQGGHAAGPPDGLPRHRR